MKFEITTTATAYTLPEVEKLSKLGFTFEPGIRADDGTQYYVMTKYFSIIEVSSLEELLTLVSTYGPLILHEDNSIEIYDYYRE